MNTPHKAWLAVLLAGGIMLAPAIFAAESDSDVAPPPLRIERAPPARDGFVWRSGHWAWSGKAYNWVDGGWVVQRRHMRWVADQWQQVGEKWHLVPAHWDQS
jgi:hypothetical protein